MLADDHTEPDLEIPVEPEPEPEPAAEPEALTESAPDLLTDPRADPWHGDFQGMVERRVIRALVTYSRTHYFLDGAQPRGLSQAALERFEKVINEKLGTGHLKLHVVAIPVRRDDILPALLEGRGDLASANLSITEDRLESIDFSQPFFDDVSELVITGPDSPALESIDDLSGEEVHVRVSSSYYDSLVALNDRFLSEGRAPVEIVSVDERLEDEDLLEVVGAGLVPAVVCDSQKAEFWAQILDDIHINPDLALRTDARIAWAFRKNSPELKAVVNDFVVKHRRGTLLGNMGLKAYLKDVEYVRNALAADDLTRYHSVVEHFRHYSEQYDLDWRLLRAIRNRASTKA